MMNECAEGLLPGTELPAASFRLSTVSMDNQRVAGMVTQGEGKSPDSQRCVVVIDLAAGQGRLVAADHDFTNAHLQYCRSTDPEGWRDLPFGRDGVESCIGHQVWRGKGRSVVTVTLQNVDTTYGWADGSAVRVWVMMGFPDQSPR